MRLIVLAFRRALPNPSNKPPNINEMNVNETKIAVLCVLAKIAENACV